MKFEVMGQNFSIGTAVVPGKDGWSDWAILTKPLDM